jgi:uncharacterized protein
VEARLEEIVRTTPWLLAALHAARDVDPPDWLLGAGAIRTAVWDRLHGFEPSRPNDVDDEVEPQTSSADAVATWPETAVCVALHLDARDRLTIVAPYGLGDLLGLVHRRNPRRVSVEEYERRLRDKAIAQRWPKATIVR